MDGAARGDGVVASHPADEVQRPAGVLGEVADVLVVALVDDAVQPALAGPRLDQRQTGLSVGMTHVVQVAFQADHQLRLGDHAVGQVTFHQCGVEPEVVRGQQSDRPGSLQVTVVVEQLGNRRLGGVVHWAPRYNWRLRRTVQDRPPRGQSRPGEGRFRRPYWCRGWASCIETALVTEKCEKTPPSVQSQRRGQESRESSSVSARSIAASGSGVSWAVRISTPMIAPAMTRRSASSAGPSGRRSSASVSRSASVR